MLGGSVEFSGFFVYWIQMNNKQTNKQTNRQVLILVFISGGLIMSAFEFFGGIL